MKSFVHNLERSIVNSVGSFRVIDFVSYSQARL